jgi:hypothetical protein
MKNDYHENCSHAIVWDNTVQEMEVKKVHSKNVLFLGKPVVARLKWKLMGMPTTPNKHDYSTEYKVPDKKGKWHVQCICIVIVALQRAENQLVAELEVKTSFVDLFEIDSSQS